MARIIEESEPRSKPNPKWYLNINLLEGQEFRGNKIYENICGWDTYTPEIPDDITKVVNWDLPEKDQKFRRNEDLGGIHFPHYMKQSEWEYPKDGRGNPDKSKPPIWTTQQKAYRDSEKKKIFITGQWYFINGYLFWIHGFHYFGLNYWHIDSDTGDDYKEFRHRDYQRWLLWRKVELSETILGMVYLKHRRDGASIDGWIMMYLYGHIPNAKCGHTNFNEADAKEAFKTLCSKPTLLVPLWLQPHHDARPNSTEINFSSYQRGTTNKASINTSITESLNSVLMCRATVVDPWDGKKMKFIFPDEAGKLKDLDLLKFVSVQLECLAQGMGSQKVGNMFMPSTSGGDVKASEQFRELLKQGMPEEWSEELQTTTSKMITYFDRASHGLETFIDEYGFSIEFDPTPVQLAFLQKKYPKKHRYVGARQYIIDQLKHYASRANWKKYYEAKSLYPLTIDDPFTKASDDQQFNTEKLMDLQFYIRANNALHKNLVRIGDLKWFDEDTKRRVIFVDNPRGRFEISKFFHEPTLANRVRWEGEKAFPMNAETGCISLDPYLKGIVQNKKGGSKGAAHGIHFFNFENQEGQYLPGGIKNPDYYPSPALFLKYKARPTDMDDFYEDILMACHYFSIRLAFEANVYDIHEYFIKRGYAAFVYKTWEFRDTRVEKISEADRHQYGYRFDGDISDIRLIARFIEGTDILYQGWDYDIRTDLRRIPFEDTVADLLKFENVPEVRTKCDLTMSLIPGLKINMLRMKKMFYRKGGTRHQGAESVNQKSLSQIFTEVGELII